MGYLRSEEVAGKPVMEIIHPDFRPVVAERIRQVVEAGLRMPALELKIARPDGGAVDVESMSGPVFFRGIRAVQVVMRDISERKGAERALERAKEDRERLLAEIQLHAWELEQRVGERTADLKQSVEALELEVNARRKAEESLRKANRALTVVGECDKALVHALGEAALLADICRIVVSESGYRMAWVGFPRDDAEKSIRVAAQTGFDEGYLESVRITWADEPHGRGPTGTAIREGRTTVGKNFLVDPELAPWREAALERGYTSSVALPLVAGGVIFGALTIYAAEPYAFGAEEIGLLEAMADDLAFGITALRLRVEQEQTRNALRASSELLERMFSNIHMAVAYMDDGFNFIRVNRAYAEAGRHPEEFYIGKNHFALYPNAENEEIFRNVVRTGQPFVVYEKPFEYAEFPEKGTTYWDWSLTPVPGPSGAVTAVVLALRDVTEQTLARKKVPQYQARLRRMASELILSEEETKRRIAKNLHDEVGQALAFCQIKLGALKEKARGALAGSLDEIRNSLGDVIKTTRSLTFEISSPVLYELGLGAAVERLLEKLQHEHGFTASFADDGKSGAIGDDARVTLYMAVRELLANVVKHASAKNVSVSIAREAERIRITVEDDGAGFDSLSTGPSASETGGFGLFSTRERLEYLGGSLEIESAPGRGTRATVIAPVKSGGKRERKE
jgi:PAS domain S-box-containing protein